MQALEPFGIPLYYDPSMSIPNVYLLTPFCVFFNGSRDILPLMCLCPSQHFFSIPLLPQIAANHVVDHHFVLVSS